MTKSEQINLEYMVEFEDGLRPRVYVYGIDSEAGEVYSTEAHIGIIVGAGYNVTPANQKELKKDKIAAWATLQMKLDVSLSIGECPRTKISNPQKWEQKECKSMEKGGWNVIKVQDPDHVKPAIDRYVESYKKQFHELAERCLNTFKGFVAEHPNYAKYGIK